MLNAIIILDKAWPFTDSGQITGLQIQANQRSLQLAPHAVYTQTTRFIFTTVMTVVRHLSFKTQHGLMDLSKGAP